MSRKLPDGWNRSAGSLSRGEPPAPAAAVTSLTTPWPFLSEPITVESSSQPGPPAERPHCIGDRFWVQEALGTGAFGAVYRCFDEQLQQDVAVKLAHERPADGSHGCEELLHEARATAKVKHPNIISVKNVDKTADGRPYVVYDLVCGKSLKQAIDTGQYTMAEAVRWVADLAEALHVAHKSGLVHRDIKPANILIDEKRQALLADFGLARVGDRFFAQDRGRLGTVAYMSPEQAAGLSHLATPQSDLYSLGVVLYELICHRRPFESSKKEELYEQIQHKAVVPPRALRDDVPPALERVCLRALAKRPEERYATGRDMARALRGVVPRGSRMWLAGVAAVVLGLAALVAAGMSMLSGPPRVDSDSVAGFSALEPRLSIKVGRGAAGTVGAPQEQIVLGAAAWRAGDTVQVEAQLEHRAYLYLYWFEQSPSGWRFVEQLWPESVDKQVAVGSIPAIGLEVTGAGGWDLILAVAAQEPLAGAQEQRLRQTLVQSLPCLTSVRGACELVPPAPGGLGVNWIDPSSSNRQRGVKHTDKPISHWIGELPPGVRDLLGAYRASYHGWLVPRA
jgi:hypothetical protein